MKTAESKKFAKQALCQEIGVEGMSRLKRSTVLVVGLGGGGCVGAHQFAMTNVGKLILCDHDTVGYSNLGRQYLHLTENLGINKTTSAMISLRRFNPDVDIQTIPQKITEKHLVDIRKKNENLIVYVAVDSLKTHIIINRFCIENSIKCVHMASMAFKGFVYTYHPNYTCACIKCTLLQNFQIDVSTIDNDGYQYPYLSPVISAVGSIAVLEGLKMLLRVNNKNAWDRLIVFRSTDTDDTFDRVESAKPFLDEIDLRSSLDCPVCRMCR
jgi:adenylyltransferase/sulfurtransferase